MARLHVAPPFADAIHRHFPTLDRPIVEPAFRSPDEWDRLARIAATAELREQLRTRTGDKLDVGVAHAITNAVIDYYQQAIGTQDGGER